MSQISFTSPVRQIYSHTGLRGIAAISVVFSHIYFFKGETLNWGIGKETFQYFIWGGYPVDLFFILSGFIMNWVYLSNNLPPINWKLYFIARFGRIAPLYYLTSILMLPLCFYSFYKHGNNYLGNENLIIKLITNTFMCSGVIGGSKGTINGPAWSISVEFFCYLLIFPFLAYFNRYLKTRNWILTSISIYFIIYLDYFFWEHAFISIFSSPWDASWLLRGIFGFSVGFLLCCIFQKQTWTPKPLCTNIICFAIVVIFILSRLNYLPSAYFFYALPFLVYSTASDVGILSQVLQFKSFQWIGERSYSIYLWHIPILSYLIPATKIFKQYNIKINQINGLIIVFLLISIILIVSEISYRFFEVPVRKIIRRI